MNRCFLDKRCSMEMLFSCSPTVIYLSITAGTPCSGRKPGREGGEREATNEWTDKHLIEPRKEGRKRMSCPVASSHFRPLPPSFFCIFSHCCGVLLSRNASAGREGTRKRRGDEGQVEGAVNISPATAVFPPFFSPSLVF